MKTERSTLQRGDVEGLVLAGGRSRRFGCDKALATVDGTPMINRVYETVASVAFRVRVSVRSVHQLYDKRWEYVVDQFAGCGPLAGIHAGLLSCEAPWLLVVATDYPFMTVRDLEKLLAERSRRNAIVMARDPESVEQPLCACYSVSLLGPLEEALRARRLRVGAFVDSRRDETALVDVKGASAGNINRQTDL